MESCFSSKVVADLALAQLQDQGIADAVADCLELGIEAASGTSDTEWKSPLLSRQAAVRRALRCVALILSVPLAVLSEARARILSNGENAQHSRRWLVSGSDHFCLGKPFMRRTTVGGPYLVGKGGG